MTIGPGGQYVLPPIKQHPSPNQSSRNGASIIGVVMHDTEGGYAGSIDWLCRSSTQASAHIVLREDGNEATQLVHWTSKAWHAVAANQHFIGVEMAGFRDHETDPQWRSAARIVSYLAQHFHFPVVWNVRHGGAFAPGITRHYDLGAAGGGHYDPTLSEDTWLRFIALCQREAVRGGFLAHWGVD